MSDFVGRFVPVAPAGVATVAAARAVADRAGADLVEAQSAEATVAASSRRRVEVDFGPLDAAAADAEVTDIVLGGDGSIWLDRGVGLERAGPMLSAPEAHSLAVRLIAVGGRHLDEATPFADVQLSDGIRVHAVLPPATPDGPLLSIRFPAPEPPSLEWLATEGFVAAAEVELLGELVAQRRNLLVTGPAGSGKTTLLGSLLGLVPRHERIVLIEDVAELRVTHPHVVRLEARQANLEGAGAIGLDRLLRESLRMRPDRLVVGECRGAELRELLSALNTGHDGGAGTLHANSLEAVPARLEALGAVAGLGSAALGRQVAAAIDAIVHLQRVDGRRRVAGIGRPLLVDDALVVERIGGAP